MKPSIVTDDISAQDCRPPLTTLAGRVNDLARYEAPIDDILDALNQVGLGQLLALPAFRHVEPETVQQAVSEFGRFSEKVIAYTDVVGDLNGCQLNLTTGTVRTPAGFRQAYEQYVEGGWTAVTFPAEYGGAGFPALVGMAFQEMLASANLSFSLNPALTQSAIELLLKWGSDEQRSTYLPNLLSGRWSGTMNLTEPEAGSDLGGVQATASRDDEGRWRVSGTKIFISWGEHDLSENIVHLVLARIPGGPPGSKGISLFLVPKFLPLPDGSLGDRNSVRCLRLEEKLGIHASPTCVMQYDRAVSELVGEPHGGIQAMFTMMNAARLSIGLQGTSVAERSFQQAYRYAQERRQGQGSHIVLPARSPLVDHPDVRRMLLSMRTSTVATRLLVYTATYYRDLAHHSADTSVRESAQGYVDLLTPIAKAWSTDLGLASASTGMQVLGGIGYLEETGMAQRLRDSRIAPIYEGTNGIQAIDLVTRKLAAHGGKWVASLLGEIVATTSVGSGTPELRESRLICSDAVRILEATIHQLVARLGKDPDDALAGAYACLEMFGLTIGGWLLLGRAERALAAKSRNVAAVVAESEILRHRTRRTSGRAGSPGSKWVGSPRSSALTLDRARRPIGGLP